MIEDDIQELERIAMCGGEIEAWERVKSAARLGASVEVERRKRPARAAANEHIEKCAICSDSKNYYCNEAIPLINASVDEMARESF